MFIYVSVANIYNLLKLKYILLGYSFVFKLKELS